MRSEPFTLAPDAQSLWLDYPFPGNVRELRNIVIRLTARFPGQSVDAATLREVKRLPMRKPSGKYNVWNKITFEDGTSH